MGWVVMGSRPCVFIRDSYEKGKRHVRDIKTYQVRSYSPMTPAVWGRGVGQSLTKERRVAVARPEFIRDTSNFRRSTAAGARSTPTG